MKRVTIILPVFALTAVILFSACAGGDGAADGVLGYFEALAAKDADRLALRSCADWEAQGQTELESFGAVEVTLEDAACTDAGEEGDYTRITCTGKLVANYGDEVLEIDLGERSYLAAFEGGEWRFCGYR